MMLSQGSYKDIIRILYGYGWEGHPIAIGGKGIPFAIWWEEYHIAIGGKGTPLSFGGQGIPLS